MTAAPGILRLHMDANPIVLDDDAEGVVVVSVEGEHDIYTAPTLPERLEEALSRGGGIVVDLTGATFVDSSVLGALLDSRRRALEASQGFVGCIGSSTSRAWFPSSRCCRAGRRRSSRPGAAVRRHERRGLPRGAPQHARA